MEKTQGFGKLIIAEIPKFVVMDLLIPVKCLKLEGKTNKTQGKTRNFRKPLKTRAKKLKVLANPFVRVAENRSKLEAWPIHIMLMDSTSRHKKRR